MLQPVRRQKPNRRPGTVAGEIGLTWQPPVNAILNVLHQRTGSTSMYRVGAPVVTGVDVDHLGMLFRAHQAITAEMNELKREIAQLKNAIEPEPLQIREISDAKAKSEVRAFFNEHDGELIYPDDVAEVLNIDLMQAVRVCDALAKEGKIEQTTRGSS